MNALLQLQDWYLRQCDGDWEHAHGIEIGTLDNPGWSFRADLRGTAMENVPFRPSEHGAGAQSIAEDPDWWTAKVENGWFIGFCGPRHLDTLVRVFLRWTAHK